MAAGARSPLDALEVAVDAIERYGARTGAFTALTVDRARAEAAAQERALAHGAAAGPLAGVPFAVKDLLDTEGVPSAYGSPMFAGHVPDADAVAVARIRAAGGLLVGKTVTHEFAWGITSRRGADGCRNPRDLERIAGGSSGGSAAVVGDGLVAVAVGTDTAGSVRIPAAFCGVIGYKPTWGTIPVAGVFPLAPSFDTVGALAATVDDAALLVDVMAGRRPGPVVVARAPQRVAVLDTGPIGPAVAVALRDAAALLAAAGAQLVEAGPFDPAAAVNALRAIQGREAAAGHGARGLFPARADEYGADVLGRLRAGAAVTAAQVDAAATQRRRIADELPALLRGGQLLLSAVAAGPPPRIDVLRDDPGADAALRDAVLPHCVLQSLLGLPACVVPMGEDPETGAPVAVQISGPRRADAAVLAAAAVLER